MVCRRAGDVIARAAATASNLMDVSPKQLVSVAAALIPFLENDDANRALMGSNMQRQAVPLVRADAPFVGTGMEADGRPRFGCRHRGAPLAASSIRSMRPVSSSAPPKRLDANKPGVDIYRLQKFQRSNQNDLHQRRSPLVTRGRAFSRRARSSPMVRRRSLGELALGRNVLVAFMPWNGYNFEDSILLSERIVKR